MQMKWRTNPEPKHGDTRKRTIFAVFPVTTRWQNEEITVWLENFQVKEQYFEYPDEPHRDAWQITERYPIFKS